MKVKWNKKKKKLLRNCKITDDDGVLDQHPNLLEVMSILIKSYKSSNFVKHDRNKISRSLQFSI